MHMHMHMPHAQVDLELSVRCVELHKYTVGASLMDRDHKDSGSSLTLSVALSDRQSFEGGEFLTWRGDERVAHRLSCGDGILFRSEDLHNVAPVRQGVRQSLVIELWVGTTNLIDRSR